MPTLVRPELEHDWEPDIKEAVEIQQKLAPLVETCDRLPTLRTVCGVDVAHSPFIPDVVASAVLLSYPSMDVLAKADSEGILGVQPFPYVPGLLAFRELPSVLDALEQLPQKPDLVIVDGHGLAHPRRFGIACHLGVLTDIPTIGCAKSLLVGQKPDVGPEQGARAPLILDGSVVGYAVRTKAGVKPVFVSTGHRVSPETAVDIVLTCCRGYRLPEPTRAAHKAVRKAWQDVCPSHEIEVPPIFPGDKP